MAYYEKMSLLAVVMIASSFIFSSVANAGGLVSTANLRCPCCHSAGVTWSGRTQNDAWGIHYIYRCPMGHEFMID